MTEVLHDCEEKAFGGTMHKANQGLGVPSDIMSCYDITSTKFPTHVSNAVSSGP